MTSLHSLFVFGLGLLVSPAIAGDWPQFRGPTGQGVAEAKNLPTTWSETESIAWKTPVPGLGWSSPAVVGQRVYMTTAVEEGPETRSLRAVCLDLETGEILWNHEIFRQTGPVEVHSKNSHASCSPIIDGDRVYIHFGPHGTAALDLDGNVLWKNEELEYGPTHGTGGSPALVNGRLIICCDGHDKQFVVALDSQSGDVIWKKDRESNTSKGFSFATPLVIEINGQKQAICQGSNVLMSLDPSTGEEFWRATFEGYSIVPRPIYAKGLIVVSTGYDDPKLLGVDPTGSGDVTETHIKWTIERGAPTNPSPVAVGDELYFVSDNGILTCADIATGKRIWQERLGGAFSASLLYADGRIYAQDEHGRAIVFEPGKKFMQIAENTLANGERTYASYAATDGTLFVRSESHLYRVGGDKGLAAASTE